MALSLNYARSTRMYRPLHAIIACAAMLLSTAVHALAPGKTAPPPTLSPGEEAAALRQAERVGLQIYRHDRAGWIATDAVRGLSGFMSERRLVGWITQDHGAEITVTFFGGEPGQAPAALYRATVTDAGELNGQAQALLDPVPLTEFEAAAAAAVGAVRTTGYDACSDRYNSVTLPPEHGGTDWVVYLLPGTTEHGVIMVGGAHRFTVNPASGVVTSQRAFSLSCLQMRHDPRAVALMVTHLLDPVPTEIHAYLSRAHDTTFYVSTQPHGRLWEVTANGIRATADHEGEGR